MKRLSRRQFAAIAASTAAAPFAFGVRGMGVQALTAQQTMDRIRKSIGVEWKGESVDGLKAGDPATPVKGVVTTSMATLGVLQQGVKAGANFFVTAQPTFYARSDARTTSADPVVTGKNDFITRNNLVVFRLSEHWRLRQPDPAVQGLSVALGLTKYQTSDDPLRFEVPAITLAGLLAEV